MHKFDNAMSKLFKQSTSIKSDYSSDYQLDKCDQRHVQCSIQVKEDLPPNVDIAVYRDEQFLHEAIESSEFEAVKALIHKGLDVNGIYQTPHPIVKAVIHERFKILSFLIDQGANLILDSYDDWEVNILHKAVMLNSSTKIVQLIINKGVNVNAQNFYGITPIHLAVYTKNTEMIDLLLRNHANINALSSYGVTPLMDAIRDSGSDRSVVECLLKNKANCNLIHPNKKTPLLLAIDKGDVELVTLLLNYGADPRMVPPNFKFKSVTNYAFYFQKNTIFGLLLKHSAKPIMNYSDQSLVSAAAMNDQKTVSYILKQNCFDINANDYLGWTPLLNAICNGNREMVLLLIQNGADVNMKSKIKGINNIREITPLFVACGFRDNNILSMLLHRGAIVNSNNMINGQVLQPMHHAIAKQSILNMQTLMRFGVDINCKLPDNNSFLHYAVAYGASRSVQFLLEMQVDVNCVNGNGFTPLEVAMKLDSNEISNLLIKHIFKIHALNWFVNENNMKFMTKENEKKYELFISQCKNEVSLMKKQKIIPKISLYDIFKKTKIQVAELMRKGKVMTILINLNLFDYYTVYSSMLNLHIQASINYYEKCFDSVSSC